MAKIDPKVKLQISAVNGTDWNDFFGKVLTQIAAGNAPDIVCVATEGLQLLASKGLAEPLDDYVKRDWRRLKTYFADVHPSLVEAMMYQGHLYELPDDFNAGNMFYSTDLFNKAGVCRPGERTGPWTTSTTSAEKIAKVGGRHDGFDWVVRLWGSWTSFMYANGGNLLDRGQVLRRRLAVERPRTRTTRCGRPQGRLDSGGTRRPTRPRSSRRCST